MSPLSAFPPSALRLLPWTNADGKPCYLISDHGRSLLGERADTVESLQLGMGADICGHARELLDDSRASADELRFLARCLYDALRDALRIARSHIGPDVVVPEADPS
ncbi:hypothetical protein [Streptomyces cucumeris]|uniref:hypothetical protein n=1 Tax=Streptomyces cucumeris TaxID=2962890 RepID=UPI0020C89807|nr:hypothetical protein [Streptomyces sp. NEAU-Y11]MCP9212834.1 hypothetical protein [Streptomyces sp. NEAU-Y11]